MGLQKELQENIKYWEQILGKEICESIHEDEIHEGWSDEYKQEYQVLQNDFDRVLQVAGGWDACMIDMPFSAFYGCFGKIAITYAMRKDLSFLRDIKETILPALYNRIIRIPLRVLVQDIHKCKDAGLLKGGDEKEEYVDYCKRFLERPEYIRQLCEAYPEMKKLLLMQILNLVLYLEEIVTAAQKDKEQLEQLFFQNGQFSCIDRIVFGQSDAHRLGRTVARVYFDQGQVLIYKPRSLCKETRFEELYESFCKEAQLSYMPVPVLDRGTYGWQTCVETKKCQDQEAVKRYFERTSMGKISLLQGNIRF